MTEKSAWNLRLAFQGFILPVFELQKKVNFDFCVHPDLVLVKREEEIFYKFLIWIETFGKKQRNLPARELLKTNMEADQRRLAYRLCRTAAPPIAT
jgi:hypothetical protein